MFKSFNPKYGNDVITIYAGEYYVSSKCEIISTVLGSCIAVYLFDPINKIGGMNHFLLPYSNKDSKIETKDSNRYGVTSINNLLKEMELSGANKKNIKAKIFGGGDILTVTDSSYPSIGQINIEFTRLYLKELKINIVNEDVGEDVGRYITSVSCTPKVYVRRLPKREVKHIEEELFRIS